MKIPWTVTAGLGSGTAVFLLAIAFSIAITEGDYKAIRNISLSLLAASCTAVTTTAAATITDQARPRVGPQPMDKLRSPGIPPQPTPAPQPQPSQERVDFGDVKHPFDRVKEVLGDELEQQLAAVTVHVAASNPLSDDRAVALFDSTSRLLDAVNRQRQPQPPQRHAEATPQVTVEDGLDLPDLSSHEPSEVMLLDLELKDEWAEPTLPTQPQPRAYPPEVVTHQPAPPAPAPEPAPRFGGFNLL